LLRGGAENLEQPLTLDAEYNFRAKPSSEPLGTLHSSSSSASTPEWCTSSWCNKPRWGWGWG
jgi:hypothetical protein